MPTFNCPGCMSPIKYRAEHAGEQFACTVCGTKLFFPYAAPGDIATPLSSPTPGKLPRASSAILTPIQTTDPKTDLQRSAFSNPAAYLVLSCLAGVVALPAAFALHRLAGLALAGVGVVFALLAGVCAVIRKRGGWFGTSLAFLAVSGSALLVLLVLDKTTPEEAAQGPDESSQSSGSSFPSLSKYPSMDSVLRVHPGYILVLPTSGTFPENVEDILRNELFTPERVTMIRRDPAQKETLLRQQLDKSLAGLPEPAKLNALLLALRKKEVRFKGYVPDDEKQTLSGIILRGGVFTIDAGGDSPAPRHGSLLHANGIKQILDHAGLIEAEPRSLLQGLRDGIRDYASLHDALAIIGNRLAFLIDVKPTAADHEEAIAKLLTWSKPPVFVPRPPPRLFDAVDPREDTTTGQAKYTLKLPRPCYWRQVSKKDRSEIDWKEINSGEQEKMKWQDFKADTVITWQPVPVPRTDGRSDPVASYDVAVVLPDRVVVFRNQTLFVGDVAEDVERRARTYAKTRLQIDVKAADELVKVAPIPPPDKGYVGTLLYSSLADMAEKGGERTGDLELYKRDDFSALMKSENETVK